MCVSRYGQNVTSVVQKGIIKFAHQPNAVYDKKFANIKQEYNGVRFNYDIYCQNTQQSLIQLGNME